MSAIVPAVPSPNGGADVFAFQNDGTIQAIASDGSTMWTAANPTGARPGYQPSAMPDFQGGLILAGVLPSGPAIFKLDGLTGQAYPAFAPSAPSTVVAPGTDGSRWAAVSTDGTVFALVITPGPITSLVGINPITGSQTLSVPIPTLGGGAEAGPIVAGDGYAYIAYSFQDSPSGGIKHVHLLRANSAGLRDDIPVTDVLTPAGNFELITNADQGVLLTWTTQPAFNIGMATTVGTNVTLAVGPAPPGPNYYFRPSLQAQDGSFVAFQQDGSAGNIVAFNADGSLRWSAPGDYPAVATDDGGVIGQSGIAYDQNGNSGGQTGSFTTLSWTLDAYQLGSVDQIIKKLLSVAKSWWPFQGGNASGNSSATQQPWYAPLPSCPGAAAPCAQEAALSALAGLKLLLAAPCPSCQTLIFNHLVGKTQIGFYNYLSLRPRLWDGTRSWAPGRTAFCANGIYYSLFLCPVNDDPVWKILRTNDSDVMSQTPTNPGMGMQAFFNPSTGICLAWSVGNPPVGDQGVLNQATLFHEALHGFTGDQDGTLQGAFTLKLTLMSVNITYYIEGTELNNANPPVGGVIPGGATGAQGCH